MQKDLDITAVIGFSGSSCVMQATSTTDCCSTLTTSTSSTPSARL